MARTLRLRRGEFETEAAALDLRTQSAQARAMDVHVSIHNKVLTGKTKEMSGPYVVGILWLVGGDCVRNALQRFFELESDDHESVAS